MKQLLQEEFNVIYSIEMIKTKHNLIKKEYRYFRNLKAKSGLGWNEELDRSDDNDPDLPISLLPLVFLGLIIDECLLVIHFYCSEVDCTSSFAIQDKETSAMV